MTHHDDELEDFLAGRDELSRQLSALKQPASPAQLDEAITASIEARLAAERAIRKRPAANMARWRAPLALAASVVGAVLLTMEWQRGEYDARVDAGMREQRPVAAPATTARSAPAPSAAAPVVPREPAAAAVTAAASAQAGSVAAPAPPAKPAPQARLRAAPPPLEEQAAQVTAPEPPKATDNSVSIIANATNVRPSAELARAPVAPEPVIAPAAPAAPAPLVFAARSAAPSVSGPASSARADAWLAVIDEMLKADLRQDALDEWRKFRFAYPNYPVPERLSSRIKAIE